MREALRGWFSKGVQQCGSARQWGGKAKKAASTITRFLQSPDTASLPSLATLQALARQVSEPLPAEVISMAPRFRGRPPSSDDINQRDNLSHAEDADPAITVAIPEIDHEGTAPEPGEEMASILAEWEVPTGWLLTMVGVPAVDHLRIITIEDDRMAGTLDVGDKVLVDFGDIDPYRSGIYLTRDGRRLSARRLQDADRRTGRVLVINDNKKYKDRELEIAAVEIVGRVIARWHPVR